MVDMFPVLRVLGILIMIFALTMGLPLAVSLWTDDGVWFVYPLSMGATLLAGAWLWWRLLRKPSPRMLQQEQRMRGMKGRTAFLPFILIVPAQWVGDLAFHAGGSEPREYTYAFVGNAVLVAVLVAVSERIRRQGSDGNRPPAAAS